MSTGEGPESRRAAIRRIGALFAKAGIADAGLEARDLLLYVLGIERAALDDHPGLPLGAEDCKRLDEAIARRLAGVPLDRIMGVREFMGRVFRLNADTLSPREDSAAIIELARRRFQADQAFRLLDLGTGSGILLITLLAEFPRATGIGTDLADGVLRMAEANANTLGVGERAQFQKSDWLAGIEGRFDLIVSNPPYIESASIPMLEREVREHDPKLALDGGADGLAAYRIIAAAAPAALKPKGVLIVEIGQGQGPAVTSLFGEQGLAPAGARLDLAGIERALGFEIRADSVSNEGRSGR